MRYIFPLVILIFCACQRSAKFEITNNSDQKLIDVAVTVNHPPPFEGQTIDLDVGESERYVLDMSKASKADGDYLLHATLSEGGFITKRFGYFTGGSSLEDHIKIDIRTDTIIFDYRQ